MGGRGEFHVAKLICHRGGALHTRGVAQYKQCTWHCSKAAHCSTAYWKESASESTADEPPCSGPCLSPIAEKGKCSSQTHLWFHWAPHLGAKYCVNIFWTHVEQARALRTETKQWFHPSAAWGTTEFNWAYWTQVTTLPTKNACPSPSDQKLTTPLLVYGCVHHQSLHTFERNCELDGVTASLSLTELFPVVHSQNLWEQWHLNIMRFLSLQ